MTELKLYNTLTRQKEVFEPIDRDNVRMYVCGPTVYDFAHIGNARPVIVFDVLYRLLRHVYGNDHVTYVRNITDVDDKINARALRDYPNLPLNDAIRAVTEKTANQFHADVKALGCLEPTVEPRATEYIDGMAKMIQTLIAKGHAYVAIGREGREVLFDVDAMPEYGELSKRKLEDQQAGARVAVEDHKKNPADFVLWKESGETEPGWDAEFEGAKIYGRPGWHIECSVMSKENLGEVFDIHGGGLDLIFPHHENEIAQSRCAHGSKVMANVWMHNGYLQVEGRKMSKSEGNFVTIHDLLRDWSGSSMRSVMLQSHYRQPIDWTKDKLSSARDEIADWAEKCFDRELLDEYESDLISGNTKPIDQRVISPLFDDLNTADAITAIRVIGSEVGKNNKSAYDLLNAIHFLGLFSPRNIGALLTDHQSGSAPIRAFAEHRELFLRAQSASANGNIGYIDATNNELTSQGLVIERSESDGLLWLNTLGDQKDDIQIQINRRLSLLAEKNYAEADKIRDELLAQGIQLKDSKDSQTGERITTWEIKR